MRHVLLIVATCCLCAGCTALPQVSRQPQFFNPFPQLNRVAVLPFFNQSNEPTVNGFDVANAYRNELQKIPGFEVKPLGVVEQSLQAHRVVLNEVTDFQQLARLLNVDAIVVGSITDFTPYYPPRMGLAVNWYAAHPCLHPIPPGYGLPWDTTEEEFIPDSLVWESEFALAREQFKAQTPPIPPALAEADRQFVQRSLAANGAHRMRETAGSSDRNEIRRNTLREEEVPRPLAGAPNDPPRPQALSAPHESFSQSAQAVYPGCMPQSQPIIQLVRQYDGHDAELTKRLSNYFSSRDDARFGGWQSYLQRKDDFINFCCYLHITDMLSARGGAGRSRLVWRWPFDRYQP